MATETATQAITGNTYQLLINGEFVASKSGETFERRNPANGDVVATCPKATEEDTDAAIRAARAAFDGGAWSKAPARQRAEVLRKTANKIREEQAYLSRLLASEVGKPLSEAGMEVVMTADVFDYYAGLALNVKGQVVSNYVDDALGLILKEPVGVVGIITPWNARRAGPHPQRGGPPRRRRKRYHRRRRGHRRAFGGLRTRGQDRLHRLHGGGQARDAGRRQQRQEDIP